ncbi:MAG: BREX-4 system phosphatase PglZ [Prevotella sp.]|nr:BREX-4 system phosphatase PglZ [Prevotella sp.]MDD7190215.1 BREX-4 system phosphatase PglZ [Prevotella sp.]MDY5313360.1 BREX-4 system phosphatase PglZ [Prevotella sp.]
MYKEFGSLEDLYQEIETDKNWTGAESSLRNRYPIRFVLFENFGDFGEFVQVCQDHDVYVQSIEKWMKEGQDDKLITYSQLAALFESYIKSLPANDFVIAPFSEITRFYDNMRYAEFDSLLKTIRLIQSPEEAQSGHQRIYVPIIGMQSKVSKFKDDPNIHIWEYHSGTEYDNYHLILTNGTTYGVKGLEERYTLCEDLRHWIALWKNVGAKIKPQIICTSKCIFANSDNAQPDNAFKYTVCNNAFEFLTEGLGINLGKLSLREEDMPYWEELASCIDVTDFDFDVFVNQRFNTLNLNDENAFVQTWFEYKDTFSRWLLKTYFVWKSGERSYLIRVLENVTSLSTSDLFSQIATHIFDEPLDEASIGQRLSLLKEAKRQHVQIKSLAEQKVKAKLSAMAADPERGPLFAMKYMSPLTLSEQCLMVEWVGQGKVEKNDIKNLFPELYAYLLPSSIKTGKGNGWTNEYFQEYCLSKVGNQETGSLAKKLKELNGSQVSFETWRDGFKTVKTLMHNRQDINIYYWIDGLGVDWIPFMTQVIDKHKADGVFLNEIYVAASELPTVTSVNKTKLDELANGKLEKIGDVDKFAHTQKTYPAYLVEEFRIVEDAISKVLSLYNGKKIAFVSDHGISYMAQFGVGLNLAGVETDHAGRCGHWLKGSAQTDNNYIVLDDGQTLCSLNNNSLSAKTPMGQGAHGGATPEEVLVPIIIVSNQKNANAYSAKLQSSEIVASSPVLRYTIKGLSSIDTPFVTYNDVDYALHNIGGDVYESERLNLVNTSTRIILHIGDFKQTDNLSINTGAQEDDLFGF